MRAILLLIPGHSNYISVQFLHGLKITLFYICLTIGIPIDFT